MLCSSEIHHSLDTQRSKIRSILSRNVKLHETIPYERKLIDRFQIVSFQVLTIQIEQASPGWRLRRARAARSVVPCQARACAEDAGFCARQHRFRGGPAPNQPRRVDAPHGRRQAQAQLLLQLESAEQKAKEANESFAISPTSADIWRRRTRRSCLRTSSKPRRKYVLTDPVILAIDHLTKFAQGTTTASFDASSTQTLRRYVRHNKKSNIILQLSTKQLTESFLLNKKINRIHDYQRNTLQQIYRFVISAPLLFSTVRTNSEGFMKFP